VILAEEEFKTILTEAGDKLVGCFALMFNFSSTFSVEMIVLYNLSRLTCSPHITLNC
jgi:hypothetical protein